MQGQSGSGRSSRECGRALSIKQGRRGNSTEARKPRRGEEGRSRVFTWVGLGRLTKLSMMVEWRVPSSGGHCAVGCTQVVFHMFACRKVARLLGSEQSSPSTWWATTVWICRLWFARVRSHRKATKLTVVRRQLHVLFQVVTARLCHIQHSADIVVLCRDVLM